MQNKQLKLSINNQFVDKSFVGNGKMNVGFTNGETTLTELAELINLGFAYSYQFKDGIRRGENFIATDFIAVDIDDGSPLNEILLEPIVKSYGSMWHTTASHSPDNNRYRVIFVLPHTLTNRDEVKTVARSLTRRLSGDMAATDVARFFYGAYGCQYEILSGQISEEFLNELLSDTTATPQSESSNFSGKTSNRSSYEFSPELIVKTNCGTLSPVKDLDKGNIHCPYHRDNHPSAFIKKTLGGTFIHCSTCQTTWWMEGSKPPSYNFYEFETIVNDIKTGKIDTTQKDAISLAKFVDISGLTANNIFLTNQRHFCLDEIPKGLTLIKSPKGTGKTTYLSKILGKTINRFASLDDYEEQTDFETEEKFYTDERVLLIGHRQALIGELCQRLGLNCYLDDPKSNRSAVAQRMYRYGVCLDSLRKVAEKKYDIIIIDEVEQVLNHFLSDTIGADRWIIFQVFTHLIESAKNVVVLDADISWISYNTLTRIRTKTEHNSNNVPTDVRIYINDWKPTAREIWVYESCDHLINKMARDFLQGKRLFVSSNSKSKIQTLAKALEELAKENDREASLLAISSENSSKPDIQNFIKNIKTEILNYQVILSSPSLGTGIDITFDDEEQHIDCVYGFFVNQINTHFEIDQQLARVRHPKEVCVWVSPKKYGFETQFNVVRDDYLRRNLIHVADSGHVDSAIEDSVRPFYQLAALLTSHQRASKNRLLQNFINYKQRQNITVHRVKDDKEMSNLGFELRVMGEHLKQEEYYDYILNAHTLNQYVYEEVRAHFNSNESDLLIEDHRFNFARTNIELFYGKQVSYDLLFDDNNGRLRRQIRLFESIRSKPSLTENRYNMTHREWKVQLQTIKDRNAAAGILFGLFSKTPIFKDGVFDDQVIITTDDLREFAELSQSVKSFVEGQLDTYTQKDVLKKPVQHLSKLLDLIGLEFEQPCPPRKINGRRISYYKLMSPNLTYMLKWVKHRENNPIGWDFVNFLYGFEYTDDELNQISLVR